MRGWRNTVEIVLFEISSSMKPSPSFVHARTSKLRPVICLFGPRNLDEVSNRILPTSHPKTATPFGPGGRWKFNAADRPAQELPCVPRPESSAPAKVARGLYI